MASSQPKLQSEQQSASAAIQIVKDHNNNTSSGMTAMAGTPITDNSGLSGKKQTQKPIIDSQA